ncbi:hypothetical protein CEXT_103371 [Caerostris extrusa]|uniref:Uncharacterized protein n=1 Tax=Caerostris extrusa TaxID=172846 RepID=A0AAV4SHL1_CAEEX|nr:hypothetical protein CEXT_103371 [Caerostris extrusa]
MFDTIEDRWIPLDPKGHTGKGGHRSEPRWIHRVYRMRNTDQGPAGFIRHTNRETQIKIPLDPYDIQNEEHRSRSLWIYTGCGTQINIRLDPHRRRDTY